MSILHIVPALFGEQGGIVGGAERYAFELARHMSNDKPTTLLSFGDREEQREVGKLKIKVIGQPHWVGGQRSNPIAAGLLKEVLKADVIHCHQQHVVASSLAAAISRLSGRLVFVSDLGGGGRDISAYISTDRWYHGHLHISQYSQEVFGHAGKKWARVIYGGVDTEKFSPGPGPKKRDIVVFVGRLMPHKGIDDLVKAMPADLPLEIIGRPYHKRFAGDLRQLAKGKDVTFREEFDDDALVDAYRRAMCVVLPSVYQNCYGETTKIPELLGQTLLEGMACGAPVICTNVASMPEVVDDGISGFIVPPNDPANLSDKLVFLRENPGCAAKMGAAGRQRVLERFTWHTVVQRCFDAYFERAN